MHHGPVDLWVVPTLPPGHLALLETQLHKPVEDNPAMWPLTAFQMPCLLLKLMFPRRELQVLEEAPASGNEPAVCFSTTTGQSQCEDAGEDPSWRRGFHQFRMTWSFLPIRVFILPYQLEPIRVSGSHEDRKKCSVYSWIAWFHEVSVARYQLGLAISCFSSNQTDNWVSQLSPAAPPFQAPFLPVCSVFQENNPPSIDWSMPAHCFHFPF